MKLRSQMLLAGALTLVVPFVGWQSVKQLYVALQQTRIDEQTLKVANMRLALSESEPLKRWLEPALEPGSTMDWYAEQAPFPIFIDGYDDDWKTLSGAWYVYPDMTIMPFLPTTDALPITEIVNQVVETSVELNNRLSVRVARREQQLYLFIKDVIFGCVSL